MEVQGQEREILYILRVQAGDDTESKLRAYGDQYKGTFQGITRIAEEEAQKRVDAEWTKWNTMLSELENRYAGVLRKAAPAGSESSILRRTSGGNGADEVTRSGREIDGAMRTADQSILRTAGSYNRLTTSARDYRAELEKTERVEREYDLRQQAAHRARIARQHEKILSRQSEFSGIWQQKVSNAAAANIDPQSDTGRQFMEKDAREQERILRNRQRLVSGILSDERRDRERAARDAESDAARHLQERERQQQEELESERRHAQAIENARRAGLRTGTPEHEQFVGLEPKQQDRILTNQQRLRAQVANDARRQREREEQEEQQFLRRREAHWRASEESILRTREQAQHTMFRANDKLSKQLIGLAGSAAHFVRGIGLLGLAGQENSEKLLRGLLKVQAGFDILLGGSKLILGIKRAVDTYSKSIAAAELAQRAEAASAELARQKSLAMAGALEAEAVAANAAANAHSRLGGARAGSSGGGVAAGRSAERILSSGRSEALEVFGEMRGSRRGTFGRRFARGAGGIAASYLGAEAGRLAGGAAQSYGGDAAGLIAGAGGDIGTSIAIETMMRRILRTGGGLAAGGGLLGTGGAAAGGGGLATTLVGGAAAVAPWAAAIGGAGAGLASGYSTFRNARFGFGGGVMPGTIASGIANTEVRFADMLAGGRLTRAGGDESRSSQDLAYRAQFSRSADETQAAERIKTIYQQRIENEQRTAARRAELQAEAEQRISRRRASEESRASRGDQDIELGARDYTFGEMRSRRAADRSTDLRIERLTDSLSKLTESGQGQGFQALGINQRLLSIAAQRRTENEGRLSEGLVFQRQQNEDARTITELNRDRFRRQREGMEKLRATTRDPRDQANLDAEIKHRSELEQQAAEKLNALSRQRRDIEREVSEEKRRAVDESIQGIKREIELRKQAIQQDRERIDRAKENFAEMEPEQQQKVLQLGKRLQADRDRILSTGQTAAEQQQGADVGNRLAAVQSAKAKAQADLDKLSTGRGRSSKSQIEKADDARMRIGQLSSEEDQLLAKQQTQAQGRIRGFAQSQSDRSFLLDFKNRQNQGDQFVTDDERRRADQIEQGLRDRTAAGLSRDDRKLLSQVDTVFAQDITGRARRQAADRAGFGPVFGAGSQTSDERRRTEANARILADQQRQLGEKRVEADALSGAPQKITAELTDKRKMDVTVKRDDDELLRKLVNSFREQLDRRDAALVQKFTQDVQANTAQQRSQAGNLRQQQHLAARIVG